MAHESNDMSHSTSSRPRRQVTLRLPTLIGALVLIVLCGLSFLGGETYQKHHDGKSTTASNGQTGASNGLSGGFGGSRSGQRSGSIGTVTAVSDTSITINNTRTNASTTYTITSSTTISDNGSTVAASDIQSGDTVLITTSGSGSTTATRILVNPSFGGGMGSSDNSSGSGSTEQ